MCKHGCENVEGDQTRVHDSREGMIARAIGRRTVFGIPCKVIDAVERDQDIHRRLFYVSKVQSG